MCTHGRSTVKMTSLSEFLQEQGKSEQHTKEVCMHIQLYETAKCARKPSATDWLPSHVFPASRKPLVEGSIVQYPSQCEASCGGSSGAGVVEILVVFPVFPHRRVAAALFWSCSRVLQGRTLG